MRARKLSHLLAVLTAIAPALPFASATAEAAEGKNTYSRDYADHEILKGSLEDGLAAAKNRCNHIVRERQHRYVFGLTVDANDLQRQSEEFPWGISSYPSKHLSMTMACSHVSVAATYTAQAGRRQLHEISPVSSALVGAFTVGISLLQEARGPKEGEVLAVSSLHVRCETHRPEIEREYLEKFLACEKGIRHQARWYRSVREAYQEGRLKNLSTECEKIFQSTEERALSATRFDLAPVNSCERRMEAQDSTGSCR
jgi:hypothetical protein